MGNKLHCWHADNCILTSSPPQQDYTCCHCGIRHRRRQSRQPVIADHGPHVHVEPRYTWDELPLGPCSTADTEGQAK